MTIAIAMSILAALLIISIFVASRTSAGLSRERNESSAGMQLARDASTALAAAYSSMESGEFDGFAPAEQVYRAHAERVGGRHVANSALPAPARAIGLHAVDSRVPPSSRFSVSQPLGDGRTGWWQVYTIKLPDWGTPRSGGRVVTYVRTWTSAGDAGPVTRPAVFRADFRPRYFADFQMLFDGPTIVGAGATIEGPVHSNGQESSFMDQYRTDVSAGRMINFEAGSSCSPSAKVSVTAGDVVGVPSCRALARRTTERYNLLRARDAAAGIRRACTRPAPSIDLLCLDRTTDVTVRLMDSRMIVTGGRTLRADVQGNRPGDRQGAVLVTAGRVNVIGAFTDPRARALIVTAAMPGATSYGTGGAPSAWIQSSGNVGATASQLGSTFGLVAEGDVVFDERAACGVHFRGALLAMTGLARSNPTWSQYALVSGGSPCGAGMTLEGSVSAHYAPHLSEPVNNAGFSRRRYTWLRSLFDNPPPMYPTAGDWEAVALEPANLDCFGASGLRPELDGCT